MKLTPPWRYSVTFLCRCLAIATKPMLSNKQPSAAGSGAAYSTNSKPSVPIGFSQGVNCMRGSCAAGWRAWVNAAVYCRFGSPQFFCNVLR